MLIWKSAGLVVESIALMHIVRTPQKRTHQAHRIYNASPQRHTLDSLRLIQPIHFYILCEFSGRRAAMVPEIERYPVGCTVKLYGHGTCFVLDKSILVTYSFEEQKSTPSLWLTVQKKDGDWIALTALLQNPHSLQKRVTESLKSNFRVLLLHGPDEWL